MTSNESKYGNFAPLTMAVLRDADESAQCELLMHLLDRARAHYKSMIRARNELSSATEMGRDRTSFETKAKMIENASSRIVDDLRALAHFELALAVGIEAVPSLKGRFMVDFDAAFGL